MEERKLLGEPFADELHTENARETAVFSSPSGYLLVLQLALVDTLGRRGNHVEQVAQCEVDGTKDMFEKVLYLRWDFRHFSPRWSCI